MNTFPLEILEIIRDNVDNLIDHINFCDVFNIDYNIKKCQLVLFEHSSYEREKAKKIRFKYNKKIFSICFYSQFNAFISESHIDDNINEITDNDIVTNILADMNLIIYDYYIFKSLISCLSKTKSITFSNCYKIDYYELKRINDKNKLRITIYGGNKNLATKPFFTWYFIDYYNNIITNPIKKIYSYRYMFSDRLDLTKHAYFPELEIYHIYADEGNKILFLKDLPKLKILLLHISIVEYDNSELTIKLVNVPKLRVISTNVRNLRVKTDNFIKRPKVVKTYNEDDDYELRLFKEKKQ